MSHFPSLHSRCLYVVLVMAVYWSTELLPLPVTSLLPVILFPLLGVMDTNTTAMVYMKGVQMMYLGSLMVALAVEESGLHRRIALTALNMAVTDTNMLNPTLENNFPCVRPSVRPLSPPCAFVRSSIRVFSTHLPMCVCPFVTFSTLAKKKHA